MSIRIKPPLSYTGMLVISLLVFVLTASLFTIAATGDVHGIRDFYKVHYQINPLTEQEESIFLELKYLAKNEPDEPQNKELLTEYDFKLRTVRAGLYVRRENDQVFESNTMNQPELEANLPPYDLNNNQIRNTLNIGERFYAYAKYDFRYSDGAKGSVRDSRAKSFRRSHTQAAHTCLESRWYRCRCERIVISLDHARRSNRLICSDIRRNTLRREISSFLWICIPRTKSVS